jgi:hypothetical protein
MRYFTGFILMLALGGTGCSETAGMGGSGGTAGNGGAGMAGDGGSGGTAGSGGAGGITGQEFPCTEQGIRDAIARGGGPHYFECDGTAPVLPAQTIIIDNSVVLDGEGKLTVDGGDARRVFEVTSGVTVELRGFRVSGGRGQICRSCQGAGAILNRGGSLILTDCTVSENENPGFNPFGVGRPGNVTNFGFLTLANTTVSNNVGGGVHNEGGATISNSTVSGNTGYGEHDIWPYGIYNSAYATVSNSTISGAKAIFVSGWSGSSSGIDIAATLVEGECSREGDAVSWTSNGYNIESPGNTCSFDHATDQTEKTPAQLNLGPLQDNGGPTETHALGAGSVAINHIPAVDCEADEDQRGVLRPQGDACDVGAVEVEVTP